MKISGFAFTLNAVEAVAVEVVANVTPWLVPAVTAWLVFDRAIRYLRWPWYVALVAGLTLELLGVAILATALELYDYNEGKRKTDPPAPLWLAILLVVLYLLAAEALTVLLDVLPVAAVGAPALFPVLSGAAFVLLALRANHRRRLDAIERERADARAKRERKKAERVQAPMQSPIPATVHTLQERVWRLHDAHPELSRQELAAQVSCAPSTVSRALSKNGNLSPS